MIEKKESRVKNYLALLLIAAIAFVGVVSHAMIASGYVDAKLAQMGRSIGIEPVEYPELPTPIYLSDAMFNQVAGNGVYNFNATVVDGGQRSWLMESPVVRAVFIALAPSSETWGVFMPFPFLLPFVIHILIVWFVPVLIGLAFLRSKAYKMGREYTMHALSSAVYAYFIVVFFQSTRMIWASQMWEPVSYLNSYRYGWVSLYLLLGFCIAMYFYCVLGTAGLQVRRKPTAKKQACIRCGYGTQGLERCPECDLEVGAFIPSKWRVNHWYLGAMFVVTFFSPVLVASVYSVLG